MYQPNSFEAIEAQAERSLMGGGLISGVNQSRFFEPQTPTRGEQPANLAISARTAIGGATRCVFFKSSEKHKRSGTKRKETAPTAINGRRKRPPPIAEHRSPKHRSPKTYVRQMPPGEPIRRERSE